MIKRKPQNLRKYKTAIVETTSQRSHMIYTEAQTLDEALDIIAASKRKTFATRKWRDKRYNADKELMPRQKVPITLPKLKFMGEKT